MWARRVPGIKGGPDDAQSESVNRDVESGRATPSRGGDHAESISHGESSSKTMSQVTTPDKEERAGSVEEAEQIVGKGKGKDAYAEESVAGGTSPGASEAPTLPSGAEDNVSGVEGDDADSEAAGLGYASLHDKKENAEDMKKLEDGEIKIGLAEAHSSAAAPAAPPGETAQQEEKQVRFAQ